jgi:SOS-response transcriptional repressor LexA
MNKVQSKLIELASKKDISQLSLRQIAKLINENNAATISYHLNKLKQRGISLKPSKGLIDDDPSLPLVSIPIVGAADCGPATIFADERIEDTLKISPSLLRANNYKDLFALRAVGRSMNRASINGEPINDGDYVIVDQTKKDVDNESYVVVVYDGMANIKKIHRDITGNQIVLYSESSENYSPIYLHEDDQTDSLIAGRVVQVVKNSFI